MLSEHFLELMEEPVFGAHTEVTDSKETHLLNNKGRKGYYLLKNIFSGQFKLKVCYRHKVLHSQGSNLHDVTNV